MTHHAPCAFCGEKVKFSSPDWFIVEEMKDATKYILCSILCVSSWSTCRSVEFLRDEFKDKKSE